MTASTAQSVWTPLRGLLLPLQVYALLMRVPGIGIAKENNAGKWVDRQAAAEAGIAACFYYPHACQAVVHGKVAAS